MHYKGRRDGGIKLKKQQTLFPLITFFISLHMLPTHRTMKNGRGDFYSGDDKYDKSHSNKSYGLLRVNNPSPTQHPHTTKILSFPF